MFVDLCWFVLSCVDSWTLILKVWKRAMYGNDPHCHSSSIPAWEFPVNMDFGVLGDRDRGWAWLDHVELRSFGAVFTKMSSVQAAFETWSRTNKTLVTTCYPMLSHILSSYLIITGLCGWIFHSCTAWFPCCSPIMETLEVCSFAHGSSIALCDDHLGISWLSEVSYEVFMAFQIPKPSV